MNKTDRLKLSVAVVLFAIIGISYALDGKSTTTKIVVAVSALAWALTLVYLRKFKQ